MKPEAIVGKGLNQGKIAAVPLSFSPLGELPQCETCLAKSSIPIGFAFLFCSGVTDRKAVMSVPPLQLIDAGKVVEMFNCLVNPNTLQRESQS